MLYTFVPNKTFDSLLEIAPTNLIPLKTINSECSNTETKFADQSSQPLK